MGKSGRGRGRPPNPLNPPKISKIATGNNAKSTALHTTDGDTTTDAGNTTDNTRRRKIPIKPVPVPTRNMFNVDDKSLSEYTESETDEIILRKSVAHKPKKMPPLVIHNDDKQIALNTINNCVTSKNYSIRHMQVGMRIDIPNEIEHMATVEALKQVQSKFYTYHSPHTKPKRIVLHGLHDMQLSELQNILQTNGINPKDVKKLTVKKPRYDGQAVYLLYFNAGSITLSELRKVKSINHVVIKWDHYRPRQQDNVAQCRNCQQLGHSSINCFMPPKCLVCAENHKTDSCPKRIKKADLLQQKAGASAPIDKSFIKCSNCQLNHTANYRGCQKRKDFLEAQAKVVNKRRSQPMRRTHYDFEDNIMFPILGKTNPTHVPLSGAVKQEQPSWADVLSGFKKEQDSAQTVINALQGMIVTMNSTMANLAKLLEALTSSILPSGLQSSS